MNPEKLYLEIFKTLKERILNGAYKPGTRMPGHLRIAKEFAVSPITSNRAIIELEKCKLVERLERKGTFVAKTPGEISLIALFLPLLPEDNGNRLQSFISGVLERAGELSIEVHVFNHLQTAGDLHKLKLQPVQGGICPLRAEPEIYRWFQKNDKPLVVIGKNEPPGDYFISVDYQKSCYELTKALLEDGFRKIAFIGDLSFINHRQARDGYLQAIADLNCGQRYVRDAAGETLPDTIRELSENDISMDAVVVMGGNLPFRAWTLLAKSERKIQLACLRESSEIDQLKDIAYIADYSQLDAGKKGIDLIREIYSGKHPNKKFMEIPFKICRPVKK